MSHPDGVLRLLGWQGDQPSFDTKDARVGKLDSLTLLAARPAATMLEDALEPSEEAEESEPEAGGGGEG